MRLVYERKRALPSVQPMNNAPFIAERLAALIEEIRSEDAKIEDSASYKLARWADELVAIRAEVEAGHAAIEAALAQGDEEVSELRAMNADKAKTIGELSSTIFKRERTFSPAEREALEVAEHELHAASHCGTPFIVNQFMAAKADILRAMLAERSANE